MTKRVVVIGQGYVGLPVSMAAIKAGFDVVGFDLDKHKIDGLKDGLTHIDDVTDADVQAALATGRFLPTALPRDIAGFDYAVITVPTPLREGAPDISFIEAAAELISRHLRPGATVILESTTYPGTTENVVGPLLEAGSRLTAGVDYHLGFSPERIDPGNETWTFERTPKIVAGMNESSLRSVQDFYDQLVDTTVAAKGTREAEMAKLLENTYRHVNIALVNELAINARLLGIDIWDVIEVASSKPFGFMPFYPGPGVGGHCLPIDPSYLSWQFERELGTVSRFVKIANDINNGMPAHVVKRVQGGLNDRRKAVNGSRILVLGVAYKKNSADARETPATGVIKGLLALGAEVRIHDPHVERYELDLDTTSVDLTAEELSAADAVLLITDHDDVDYQLVLQNADYIFDARHRLEGADVESL
ncbi:MAG: nucleotide sugar dehydrogenase [Acidimicrobiia bacterium]|nr:nucleotide sugar dehydrogenase [Acidimicrobiia bacterium]